MFKEIRFWSWFFPLLFVESTTGYSPTSPDQLNIGVFRRRRPIRLARARSSVGDIGGPSGALKNLAWAANAAIQRAPSRLYRLHEQASTPSLLKFHPRRSQSFRELNVTVERQEDSSATRTCCGPEFIVKSSLPPHTIILPHQPKKVVVMCSYLWIRGFGVCWHYWKGGSAVILARVLSVVLDANYTSLYALKKPATYPKVSNCINSESSFNSIYSGKRSTFYISMGVDCKWSVTWAKPESTSSYRY